MPATTSLAKQRWVKPYPTTPGFWKQQLPTKALALAVKGDIAAMERLLTTQPEALDKRGPHGRTLIWEAARRGHADAVAWLLDRGADPMATGCYNGESVVQLTPYCAAVYYRRPAVAEILKHAGADELDVCRAAFLGNRTRMAALLAGDPSLLNSEDPHDEIYFTPLIAFAVAGGQAELTKELVERGAEVARYGAQLLRIALTADRPETVRYLIANGVDARMADSGIFQVSDDIELLEELLARGASTNGVVNGFPPLVFVARGDKGEHPEKLELLLQHGADVNSVGGKEQRTALHYAAAVGHDRVVDLLLAHGADTQLRDGLGLTAGDLARTRGHGALAERLR